MPAARHAVLVCALFAAQAAIARPTVDLVATADAAIYQDDFGLLANSLGQHIFAGETVFALLRRSLIRFDVSAIPADATIDSVSLRLFLTRSISGHLPVTLHRVTRGWNEGPTAAAGQEGGGEFAAPGDPTWLHASYDTDFWANAGGDFDPAASASQLVDFTAAFFVWSGPGMVGDVQSWVSGTNPNHGWMLVGTEGTHGSAKRFASRDNIDPQIRPLLTVAYTVPPQCPGDANGDLVVNFADVTFVLANFNNPFTFADVTLALANFNTSCAR